MFDGKAFGAEIVGAVKAHMAESLAPVISRLDALERRIDDATAPSVGEGDLVAVKAEMEAIRGYVFEKLDKLNAEAALPAAKDGKDGADGVGLAGAIIDRGGNLVVTLTDGTTRELGAVVGKDGQDGPPGQNGRDGFSLSDFDATLMDDGRTVLLSFEQGDQSFKVELGIPAMIYRGVFKEGQRYEKGDTVTWGGSLWHCDVETTEKPDSAEKHWTLAAKRGRDGKDGAVKAEPEKKTLRV